jgi:hypothetical protein
MDISGYYWLAFFVEKKKKTQKNIIKKKSKNSFVLAMQRASQGTLLGGDCEKFRFTSRGVKVSRKRQKN